MQGERRCRGEGVEGLPDGCKEETSSFTALFRVPGECLWIQVSAALVVDDMGGELTSRCWQNSCPLKWEV